MIASGPAPGSSFRKTQVPGSSYRHKHVPDGWVSVSSQPGNYEQRSTKPTTHSNKHVYYETLKPIFIVLTLAGVLPIFRIKAGNHKLQAVIVGAVCLSVYSVFSYMTYLETTNILQLVFNDDDFNSVIVQATLMMVLIQQVFFLLLTWPESLSVNHYLVQWKHFQSKFESVTGKKLVLMCKTKTVIAVLVALVFSIVYPFVVNSIDEKSVASITVHLTLTYHIFVQLCFYVLWFGNSWAVTQTAQQFNTIFVQECEEMTAERLQEFRLLWLRQVQLVRAGSSMLCYTMAMALTIPFVYQVIGAYNITMFVIRSVQEGQDLSGNAREAVTNAITFTFYGLLLYKFCDAGHCITSKCEKIKDILLTYKPKMPSAAINSEVRLFLRCMRSVPPQATLSGYVIINRRVYLNMTGVLITYLIILVQFNIGTVHNTNHVPATNIQSQKYVSVYK